MILWKDFVLDDEIGPSILASLLDGVVVTTTSCRSVVSGSPRVMEDAMGSSIIQETRRDQRPARMVGYTSLDVQQPPSMEAGRCDRIELPRQTRERE